MIRNAFLSRSLVLVGLLAVSMQPACVVCTTGQCGGADQSVSDDLATPDLATPDLATPDLATPDLATPDLATPDLATPDLATPDLMPPADLMPLPPPTVTTFSPAQGPTTGGTTLTITGTNFQMGATVTINGAAATVVTVTATTITVTTPAQPGALGKVAIVVKNPDNQTTTVQAAAGFSYFSGTVAFPDPVYETGNGPSGMAIGDFNGDGKKDLITANNGNFGGDNSLTILLGNGSGGFGPGTAFVPAAGATNPYAVAVGDFNGDNKADIAFTDLAADQLLVALGAGNGTFAVSSTVTMGVAPQGLALGDLNGDGKLDVVTANGLSDNISVRLGNGGGALGAEATFNTGATPLMVSLVDVNGDNKLDVVTVNGTDGNVSLLLGDGTGKFAPAAKGPFAVTASPDSLTVGDINGDGKVDVVVGASATDKFSALIGDGAGGFAAAVNYNATAGSKPLFLALADVNGDNKLDLVSASSGSGGGNVLLNDGTGKFQAAAAVPGGALTAVVVATDLNGDAKVDLAFANGNNGATISNNVSVLLGNGAGVFAPQGGVAAARGTGSSSVATGDLSGDNKLDYVYVLGNRVAVVLGNGMGGNAAAATLFQLSANGTPSALVVADFNGDNKLDVAATDSTNVVGVFLGDGTGKLGAVTTTAVGAGPKQLAAVDVNGDNKLDLITVNQTGNNISVLLGKGDGTFNAAVNTAAGAAPFGITTGDFNGDAKLDVIVSNPAAGTINVLTGNGNGTFNAAVSAAAGKRPFGLQSADVDGDGKRDLIVANQITDAIANAPGDNAVSVLLGLGNGTFSAATKYVVGTSPFLLALADFNGDSLIDIAASNAQGGSAGVLVNIGAGSFSFRGNFNAIGAAGIAVGDFNGDSRPDIVAGNTILLNGSR